MNESNSTNQPRDPVPVHVVGQFSWGLTILFVLASVCWGGRDGIAGRCWRWGW
jgi:hypothetical protein